jgi:YHS domain-containing protein
MVKVVVYLFLSIILISLLRSVLGVVGKVLRGLLGLQAPGRGTSSEPRAVGELKRDPVCGTYVSTATSVKRSVDGEVVYFCSQACSEKYRPKG